MPLTSTNLLNRAAFARALASQANRAGSEETIQTILQAAEEKILAGGGEVTFLTTASGGGKTGGQESRMDAAELFTLAEEALAIYRSMTPLDSTDPHAGARINCTYPDFSGLNLGPCFLPRR